MSRGYGKSYRKTSAHTSIQFDSLYKENSNKPSAARSAGIVGKWGITSFTSIRSTNGYGSSQYEVASKRLKLDDQNKNKDPFSFDQSLSNNSGNIEPVKPKKFFKSRNVQPLDEVKSDSKQFSGNNKVTSYPYGSGSVKKPKSSYGAKKFFQSKQHQQQQQQHQRSPSPPSPNASPPKRDDNKPPIVLRICRGKSRLLSDSDESESTPTPSSAPTSSTATSPRSTKDSQSQPTRITRSTRRSMQLETGSSPATAETPIDTTFSLLLSPEYIPPEKFELERKAMYENLLGPSSPKQKSEIETDTQHQQQQELSVATMSPDTNIESHTSVPSPCDNSTHEFEMESSTTGVLNDSQQTINSVISGTTTVTSGIYSEELQSSENMIEDNVQEPIDTSALTEQMDQRKLQEANDLLKSTNIDFNSVVQKLPEPEPKKPDAVDESLSESDSESSQPLPNSVSDQQQQQKEDVIINNTTTTIINNSSSNNNNSSNINTNSSNSTIIDATCTIDPVATITTTTTTTTTSTASDVLDSSNTSTTNNTIANNNSNKNNNNNNNNNDDGDDDVVAASTIEKHKEEIMEKILEKPLDAAPVKLVISKKKGSIFKSRTMIPEGSKKRRALYKHKWSDDKDAQKGPGDATGEKKDLATDSSEYDFESMPLTRVTRSATNSYDTDEFDSVTSVRCAKTDKDYYTVVRNVKKAHQIQEIGEFQEFNDDVEYILDALKDNNPTGTRCLSAISLATKCMAPAFRMHVRAHGIVAKFFKALHDATKDQSLGLCTATVMFVLSQDRLNMDLDRDCLELMLNLLESDVSYQKALDECGLTSAQLLKNKMKVKELCAEIQSQGHAMHLNLDNITVGQLAMETLLSLTSKRAGEWFKEELRELGGIQHIVETICECCRQVSDYVVEWTDQLLDKLRKVDRCMRVLENVTQNNEQNQTYLLKYNDGLILDTLVKLYRLCDAEIPLYPSTDITDKESTGFVIREALLVTLKVLINLTHHFNKKSTGSCLIGQKPGIIDASLHLLLQIPHYIPEQKKFELGVLVLMLLINLIQDDDNKKLLINAKAPANFESIFSCDKSALEVLIAQFYNCQELAKIAEKRTDAILDGEKDTEAQSQPKSHEEFIEETVAKLLQKAGIHMEYTFLASYIAMLIGFLIKDNPEYENKVRQFLKGRTFMDMVEILRKFFSFMNLTASTEASICQIKDTEIVIKYMEECDNRYKKLQEESSSSSSTIKNIYGC